jgi:oxygen-independent coproporphyrinogen-3 oxidase
MAGLYLHIPFCQKKCSYCDFFSVEGEQNLLPAFINTLCHEMTLRGRPESKSFFIETIYFGGGTPSLLTPDQISCLLDGIRSHFRIALEPEITLESNPCTLSAESMRGYRKAGINRISIGVQSFQDKELNLLGRLHSADQAEEALHLAKNAGFKQIGIDLICGFPHQALPSHEVNLKKAVSQEPDHISIYALTWSEHTAMGQKIKSGTYPRPHENTVRDMLLMTHENLSKAGYEHYEISNFAKPGSRCRHNEGYWTGKDYLGLGPSAHSYWHNKRFWNSSDVKKYMTVLSQNKLPVEGKEVLNPEQKRMERIYLGLRRKEGIPLHLVGDQEEVIEGLIQAGLASVFKNTLRLTPHGLCLADEVALRLLNEDASIT